MRQYIYGPKVLGLAEWPKGQLRLDFAETPYPATADIFVVPGSLGLFESRQHMYATLPFLHGNEHKHVFLGLNENTTVYDLPCIFLRSNLKTWMLARDPNSITIPWPVDDFGACVEVPAGGFANDISFHGWVQIEKRGNGSTRARALEACEQDKRLRLDFAAYSSFYGHLEPGQQSIRREWYERSLRRSRFALCPESIPGDIPYRFYEAMSAARIPILVASDYVLPELPFVNWATFTLLVERNDTSSIPAVVHKLLQNTTEAELQLLAQKARWVWESWCDRNLWQHTFTVMVASKLLQIQKETIQL